MILVYLHLPDYREETTHPLDVVGLILFGSGIALCPMCWRSSENTRSVRERCPGCWSYPSLCSQVIGFMPASFIPSAAAEIIPHSHLSGGGERQLLHSSRHWGSSLSSAAALPGGLGLHAIQSGLLVMPQAIAAMSMKAIMPGLLRKVGYRGVLISNTLILGVLLMVFATIGLRTPVWLIVLQAFLYGAFTSLQYTSMNTLVYADIDEDGTSSASSIASTMQQMSISFGVATAGLATAFFVPSVHTHPAEMIRGIHKALIGLGILTIVSTIVFRSLKSGDGDDVSQHKVLHPGG